MDDIVLSGMMKVASVIESNPSYDNVLGHRLNKDAYDALASDTEGRLVDHSQLADFHAEQIRLHRPRVYQLPNEARKGDVLCFASTLNNRREIKFLERSLEENGIALPIPNVCDYVSKRSNVKDDKLQDSIEQSFVRFLESREEISRGLLHQTLNYGRFLLGASRSLRRTRCQTFVVANDHAPAPVAYAKIASLFGRTLVYVQHAEITYNFPPLDFDYSILRNTVSKEIYSELGDIHEGVVVAPRHATQIEPASLLCARQQLREKMNQPAYIYPTSVSNPDAVAELFAALAANPHVSDVTVKVHPSGRDLESYTQRNLPVTKETPAEAHLAVCGNSSVAIELLAGGSLVYQCFELDNITPDYYGFVERGLAEEVEVDQAAERFWAEADGEAKAMSDLGRYVSNISSPANIAESVRFPRILRQAFAFPSSFCDVDARREESLLRDVYALTTTALIRSREAPNSSGDDWWLLKTLNQAFKRRDIFLTSAYSKVDVNSCSSVLEFWLVAQAIEWTGRVPAPEGLENLMAYVRSYAGSAKARRWMEAKLLDILLRLGAPAQVLTFLALAQRVHPQNLSANKMVALYRYADKHRYHRPELLAIFEVAARNLSPLEQLKVSVQGKRGSDGSLEYTNFRDVEDEFLRHHTPIEQEYKRYVRSTYQVIGDRAAFIDVERNDCQRSRLIKLIKQKLLEKRGFSFIRLSDGEGLVFRDDSSFFTKSDSRNRQRHWWGEEVSDYLLDALISELREAVRTADLIGIPSIYRFLRDHSNRTRSLGDSVQGRGLLSVLAGIRKHDNGVSLYTDDKANLALFANKDSIGDLASSANKLVVVSSGSPQDITQVFEPYGETVHVAVPTHNKTKYNTKYYYGGRSLPYVRSQVDDELSDTVEPGDLVLVGSGVAGKGFVHTAQRRNAVGLDIGSSIDQLLNANIHSLY